MLKKITAERVLYFIAVGLLAYMPFHIFLSRWLSLYTGGLGQWDAGKDIITLVGLVIAIFIAIRNKLFQHRFVLMIFLLSALYGLIHVAFFIFNREDQDYRSFIIATLYNGRILAYLFMGMVIGLTQKVDWHKVAKVVLIASTITCLIAIVQYIAPKDLMTHFGYSIERGVKPAFFIDDKPDFPRVMSTIRDPNSYGAYLIVPITMLWVFVLKKKWSRNRLIILLSLHLAVLFLTFSRGAWIGAFIAIAATTYLMNSTQIKAQIKKHLTIILGMLIILLGAAFVFRNSYVFQNVILHSDESTIQADPNELRVQMQKEAVSGIISDPEGRGPGAAGLVAIGNPKGGVLTENYYLQIALEVGITGLLLYLLILALVYYHLRQKNGNIPIVILGTFWAYIFISMLIHLWSNEAVAVQWWLLAGVAAITHITVKPKA